jgi:hypothetical protein
MQHRQRLGVVTLALWVLASSGCGSGPAMPPVDRQATAPPQVSKPALAAKKKKFSRGATPTARTSLEH